VSIRERLLKLDLTVTSFQFTQFLVAHLKGTHATANFVYLPKRIVLNIVSQLQSFFCYPLSPIQIFVRMQRSLWMATSFLNKQNTFQNNTNTVYTQASEHACIHGTDRWNALTAYTDRRSKSPRETRFMLDTILLRAAHSFCSIVIQARSSPSSSSSLLCFRESVAVAATSLIFRLSPLIRASQLLNCFSCLLFSFLFLD
jgi:hypothetical protein